MSKIYYLLGTPILFALAFTLFAFEGKPASEHLAVQHFMREMVEKHGFNYQELKTLFARIPLAFPSKQSPRRDKPKIMTWEEYRSLFLTEERIANGIKFWQENKDDLERAENFFNIPAHIIVAILGIETSYGDYKGKSLVLETLTKKSFGNHRRKKFYRKELQHFLLLTRENFLSPLTTTGSHAGALGYAQFIPSSYRYYAIDFDGDKKIDLINNPADAIGSIANYLAKHRWQNTDIIAHPILLNGAVKNTYTEPIKPKTTTKYWHTQKIATHPKAHEKMKSEIVMLTKQRAKEYWMIYWNFYVITRYNHSNYYAMAVYQLSQILKENAMTIRPNLSSKNL